MDIRPSTHSLLLCSCSYDGSSVLVVLLALGIARRTKCLAIIIVARAPGEMPKMVVILHKAAYMVQESVHWVPDLLGARSNVFDCLGICILNVFHIF